MRASCEALESLRRSKSSITRLAALSCPQAHHRRTKSYSTRQLEQQILQASLQTLAHLRIQRAELTSWVRVVLERAVHRSSCISQRQPTHQDKVGLAPSHERHQHTAIHLVATCLTHRTTSSSKTWAPTRRFLLTIWRIRRISYERSMASSQIHRTTQTLRRQSLVFLLVLISTCSLERWTIASV